ncbi:MAG: 50S ribosomal protein L9 [Acidobacteria bacterium]|nr:50S ribosomal protein L9 [Acidobacteriota bacterium]
MKLILQETVDNLGGPGDLVEVKAGYGRNFLLPQGLAVVATAANELMVEELQAKRAEHEEAAKAAAQALAASLSGVSVNVKRKVSEGDTLYGSVTAADIAEALAEEGFEVGKDQIRLEHAIKALGVYEVTLHLPYGVEATIKLWVVKDETE